MIIEMPREERLASIQSNRERHVADLEVALASRSGRGHRSATPRAGSVAQAGEGGHPADERDAARHPRVRSPESYETDYDVAIGVLEMASAELVELSESDCARYVHDQWDWRSRIDEYLEEVRFKGRYTRPSRRRA